MARKRRDIEEADQVVTAELTINPRKRSVNENLQVTIQGKQQEGKQTIIKHLISTCHIRTKANENSLS